MENSQDFSFDTYPDSRYTQLRPRSAGPFLDQMAGFSVAKKMMTLDELTQAMHDFVDGKGWYTPDSPKPQTPKNIAFSLAIEAGEVLEHFQWSDDPQSLEDLSSELADVALYLLQLASVTGINLEQAILNKLAVNTSRTWPEPGQSLRVESHARGSSNPE